ncbi:MAG: class II fructose-bisphosphate aldolase [Kiritimatiellae bacterium]|nr:class II fructose-bisphosphate aldolase [Kiritimatiellia bacterium]
MLVGLKEILKIAEADKNAVGMFNGTGFDSIRAVIEAAEELNRPVIIGHAEVHNVYSDISIVGAAMLAAAKAAKVPVCVHLDHGVTLEMCYRALRIGFTGIMIDASALPYEENLAVTRQVTEAAHAMGADVEAELGKLSTPEAGSTDCGSPAKPEDFYTAPDEAREFCDKTGIDALAVAFGTAHGFYKSQPKLDFNVVRNCAASTGIPLVMHGGSGVSPDGFQQAIAAGIRKINYYSYMSKAGYEAAARCIAAGSTKYLHDVEFAAYQAMKEDAKQAIRMFSGE